jgi:hypothetical protein
MIERWPRLSDARFLRFVPAKASFPVIPAKAGIQALNGIVREAHTKQIPWVSHPQVICGRSPLDINVKVKRSC